MLNIIEGKEVRPVKGTIYGPEGIGKTSFASQLPYPLFIDTEGGTSSLNVRRIKCTKSWDELLEIIKEVYKNPSICKTLVIDSADWAEQLAIQHVCDKYRKSSIEEIPYGKGYTYVQEEFAKLLKMLDELLSLGINTFFTAHAKPRKFELPEELGQFDKYEMKLSRQVAPLLKEWCDMLLFANYKIYVVATDTGSKKAQGGKRVMYTTHNPCWDAKNRFGLAEELELSFSSIAHLFEAHTPNVSDTVEIKEEAERPTITKLKSMMTDAGVSESELMMVVASRGHYKIEDPINNYSDDFITRWIMPNWKKIVEMIMQNREAK